MSNDKSVLSNCHSKCQTCIFILPAPAKGVNVDGVGNVNGVNIYEYDLDTGSEDKPWRKPGEWIMIITM